jgi:Na+/proline symporter
VIARKQKNRLTFGDFVTAIYDAKGKRKAAGFVCLAVNAHVIHFQQQRFSVSLRSPK